MTLEDAVRQIHDLAVRYRNSKLAARKDKDNFMAQVWEVMENTADRCERILLQTPECEGIILALHGLDKKKDWRD